MRTSIVQYTKQEKAGGNNSVFRFNPIDIFSHVYSIFSVQNDQPLISVDHLQKKSFRYHINSDIENFHCEHIWYGNNITTIFQQKIRA